MGATEFGGESGAEEQDEDPGPSESGLPVGRQVFLGVEEDFEDGALGGKRYLGVFGGAVASGEDFEEPGIDFVAGGGGQLAEGVGVDEVAAGVFEEAGAEVEFTEGAAFAVFGAELGEGFGEVRIADDGGGKGNFLGEEEVADDAFDFALEVVEVAVLLEGDGGLVVQAGEEIVHVVLMLEDEEGDDVAGGCGIFLGVEEAAEVGEVAEVVGVLFLPGEGGLADEVAAVDLFAVFAGDVPAAPALGEGGAVGDEGNAGVQVNDAGVVGAEGADEMAGDAHGLGRGMAFEALVVADETGLGNLGLLEGVEDAAELGVHHGEFQEGRTDDVADVGVVIEVDGAGVFRVDAFALEGGFGKDQALGGFGNVQRGKDRGEVAELGIEFESDLALVDFVLQIDERAAGFGLAVINRVFVEGHEVSGALKVVGTQRRGSWGEREGKEKAQGVGEWEAMRFHTVFRTGCGRG